MDFRTDKERERDERNDRLCGRYLQLKRDFPNVPDTRLFNQLAVEEKLTSSGVRYILEERGVYKGKYTKPDDQHPTEGGA